MKSNITIINIAYLMTVLCIASSIIAHDDQVVLVSNVKEMVQQAVQEELAKKTAENAGNNAECGTLCHTMKTVTAIALPYIIKYGIVASVGLFAWKKYGATPGDLKEFAERMSARMQTGLHTLRNTVFNGMRGNTAKASEIDATLRSVDGSLRHVAEISQSHHQAQQNGFASVVNNLGAITQAGFFCQASLAGQQVGFRNLFSRSQRQHTALRQQLAEHDRAFQEHTKSFIQQQEEGHGTALKLVKGLKQRLDQDNTLTAVQHLSLLEEGLRKLSELPEDELTSQAIAELEQRAAALHGQLYADVHKADEINRQLQRTEDTLDNARPQLVQLARNMGYQPRGLLPSSTSSSALVPLFHGRGI